MDEFLKGLGVFFLTLAGLFLKLFVLKKIWVLAIMPLGAPHITYWQVYGIMIFVGAMTGKYRKDSRSLEEKTAAELIDIVGLLISWGLAYWIFH